MCGEGFSPLPLSNQSVSPLRVGAYLVSLPHLALGWTQVGRHSVSLTIKEADDNVPVPGDPIVLTQNHENVCSLLAALSPVKPAIS